MKRLKRAFLFLFLCFLMVSCQRETSSEPSVVFHELVRTPYVQETESSYEFPATHNGVVIGHSLLENHVVVQEEMEENGKIATQYWCNVLRENGETLFSVTPAGDIGYYLSNVNIATGDVFRLTDAVCFENAGEACYLFATPAGLCSYSSEGALRWTNHALCAEDLFIWNQSVFALYTQDEGQTISKINLGSGEIEKKFKFTADEGKFQSIGGRDPILIGEDNGLYAANHKGLYQLSLSEEQGTAEVRLLAEWSFSGILPEEIRVWNVIDEETIEVVRAEPSTDELVCIRYKSTTEEAEANTEENADEVVLALFTTRTDYQLPVYHYNQGEQEDKIVIRDYSVYDQELQSLRLNTDMAVGDTPDMIIMWQYDTIDPAISTYERADLFADLTSLLKEAEEFRYDALLAYVTEPYQFDGKQWIFPLTPSFSCNFGPADSFNGPLTMEEYLDLCEQKNFSPLVGNGLFSAAVDDYYNETTAVCTFNNGVLAKQITRAGLLQQNTGEQPLKKLSLSSVTLYNYVKNLLALGAAGEWVPVGCPNEERALCIENYSAEYFAIFEASTHKETAVDFLHTLIQQNTTPLSSDGTEDSVLAAMGSGYVFYENDIDEQLNFFLDKTFVLNGDFVSVYDDTDPKLSGQAGVSFKLTQDDADSMRGFLNSITRRVNTASPVQRIFWEEYWSMGDRPVETMLDYVQSKVSLYLAETMD